MRKWRGKIPSVPGHKNASLCNNDCINESFDLSIPVYIKKNCFIIKYKNTQMASAKVSSYLSLKNRETIKYCQICNITLFLQIEFAVHMTCEKCVDAISKSLADLEGIRNVDISLERGTVILETNLPFSVIQERIERTRRQAVLKGYGGLN